MDVVSIIVPMYNAERRVGRVYESIAAQTYQNFELLLCDDGSSDGTLVAAQEIAARDSRVKVLSLPHSGVSRARNAGLREVKGDFVTFIDVDDVVPNNALATYMDAVDDEVDIVTAGCTIIEKGGRRTTCLPDDYSLRLQALAKSGEHNTCFDRFLYSMFAQVVWGKVFRTTMLRNAGLYFNEDMIMGEDTHFMRCCLIHCRVVCCLPISLYEYRRETLHRKYFMNAYQAVTHIELMHAALRAIGMHLHADIKSKWHDDIELYRYKFLYYSPCITSNQEFMQQMKELNCRYGIAPLKLKFPIMRHLEAYAMCRWPRIGYYLRILYR